MRNNELSAWTLLVASAILGSVTMLSLSGCKPPATTRVDVSTEEYVESNTTARDSNVTTTTSQAVETPMPADDAASENAVVAVKDAAAADASNQLIADNSKEVVSAGGDWPQWLTAAPAGHHHPSPS